jgi:hypothetical protein
MATADPKEKDSTPAALFAAAAAEVRRLSGPAEQPARVIIVTASGLKIQLDFPRGWKQE